ncbi:MAG TPA: sigma-70 family RNA polymerase sigma factor [Candidatus Dormibacteraeota bacterium]|nr:sigma-70 family RNA polymerase sigma factor [Candidatus Dormibacteraeota bacterium]
MAVHAAVLRPRPRAVEPTGAAASGGDGEEAALLLAVGRGDRDRALPELYRRYERRLFGLGVRLLGDAGLAEELVQETFLRVWRTADRFDPARGTVTAFILTIARRLAIDLWRRPSSRPLRSEPEAAGVEETIDRLLLQLAVRDALDSLPAAQREVLELSYHGDLTQTEVATRLGVPLGTVKSRAYHALRAFRRAVQERGIDG